MTEAGRPSRNRFVVPISLLAMLVMFVVVKLAWVDAGRRDLVRWVPVAEASTLAGREQKIRMFDFSAAWCGPCRILEREVFADPELSSMLNGSLIPVKIMDRQREDGRNSPAVAQLQEQYGVQGFPTLVFADPSGAMIDRVDGYPGKAEIENRLRNAIAIQSGTLP